MWSFVHWTGAFLLTNEKNSNYKYFYRKSFFKIGIPVIIFTVLYIAYEIFLKLWHNIDDWKSCISIIKSLIVGRPFYHMWYVYMLIGIYILIPVLIIFKGTVTEKTFCKIAWLFLLFGNLSIWTGTYLLQWDIGRSFCYLGYVMVGYELRRLSEQTGKNNSKGCFFIVIGILLEIVVAYVQYRHTMAGISEDAEKYSLIGPANPVITLASIFIFAGFSFMHINGNFYKLSSYTFLIYLFHAGILDLIEKISVHTGFGHPYCRLIPILIIFVFFTSYLGAIIYNCIWNKIDNHIKLPRN